MRTKEEIKIQEQIENDAIAEPCHEVEHEWDGEFSSESGKTSALVSWLLLNLQINAKLETPAGGRYETFLAFEGYFLKKC